MLKWITVNKKYVASALTTVSPMALNVVFGKPPNSHIDTGEKTDL